MKKNNPAKTRNIITLCVFLSLSLMALTPGCGGGGGSTPPPPNNTNGPLSTSAGMISAGSDHTCAVTASGGVKCWGANNFGQLGNGIPTGGIYGYPTGIFTPVDVLGILDAITISTGWRHNCVIVTGGTAKCWGDNSFGQLGDGTNNPISTSVYVQGISGATAISAGSYHTCALIIDGTVKCWGYNHYGQLGNGTKNFILTPVNVRGISDATAISTGWGHSCAIVTGGTIKCWGINSSVDFFDCHVFS